MIFNQELKDKIEDALIHFEDAGYSFQVHYDFFCNPIDCNTGRYGNKVYDVLKKVSTDDSCDFGDRIYINLSQKKNVLSWKEYQWYQSELKTAVTRMTDNFDNVNIINSSILTTDSQTGIEINGKTWKFKNLKELADKCKYFSANNKFGKTNNVIVYPEYHPEEGIVVYVREIHTDKESGERFSLLNQVIKPEYYDDEKEEIIDGHKVTTVTTREKLNVSLERAFGKDCVIKTYEEGEAEKENPYLSGAQSYGKGTLTKFIVAKIKCDFIKV
jgi:hypothetical protein